MLSNFNGLISGGTFTSVNVSGDETSYSGFGLLAKNTCIEARHNSGDHSDESRCHPGTRVEILKHLVEWASGPKYKPPIKWLHGPAGGGKTVILKTVAEILDDQKVLLGDFFFRRTAAGRNNAQQLFATIAYQVCMNIPASRPYIEAAVKRNPLIFNQSQSMQAQADELIITPLLQLSRAEGLPTDCARVIIIDGLDECHDADTQRELLMVLEKTIRKLPPSFAILVASRPEHHIREMFDLDDLNKSSSRMALGATYKADADIKTFFVDRFQKIQKHHPLRVLPPIPEPWPTIEIVNALVRKASGQFIYASTVIKFVDSPRHNPAYRLGVVLGSETPGNLNPFGQLDDLYSAVFQSIDEKDRVAVLTILSTLLCSVVYNTSLNGVPSITSSTPIFLASFLDIETHEIRRLLLDLESLLAVKADNYPITIFHASLPDFLFDRFRSGLFFINRGMTNEWLARRCLDLCFVPHGTAMTDYLVQKLPWFLQNATPTRELQNAVQTIDILKLAGLRDDGRGAYGLHCLCEPVLKGIQKSTIPSAEDVYTQKLDIYKNFLRKKMEVYLKNCLTHLLLFSINPEYSLLIPYSGCLALFFPISEEILRRDREDGLWLLTGADGVFRRPLFLLKDLIHDVMQAKETKSYTDLALHLAKGMRRGSSFYASASEIAGVVDDRNSIHELPAVYIMKHVFPAILSKSAIRLDLVKYLTDYRVASKYREHQEIRDAIHNYLTRAKSHDFDGVEPSQHNLELESSPFQIGPRKSLEEIIHAHPDAGRSVVSDYTTRYIQANGSFTLGSVKMGQEVGVVWTGEYPFQASANKKGGGRSWTPILFNIALVVAVVASLLAIIRTYTT